MLVTFKSKGASDIHMFSEHASEILRVIGKSLGSEQSPRGIITASEVGPALAHLRAAANNARARADEPGKPASITLTQRSFPLIEMLDRAAEKNLDVTWGV